MSDLLAPGQLFAGRYRIERFLAQGGFGAVYVAEQLATESKVAIKVLWPRVLGSIDAVEKFQQEARIAGRVNSDHIVRVFDAGLDDQLQMPFLVMELLKGQDLQRVVEGGGPLSVDDVVMYTRQAASALDKAHAYVDRNGAPSPIVHRDLKPENLFITHRDDGTTYLKILDFGIAKILSQSTQMSQEVKGTPLYMAYEQAAAAPITPQTDIWSLGLIVFYLLSGMSYWKCAHKPDAGLTALLAEILALPMDPASARLASFGSAVPWPPAFDEWFARCVNREPGQRFGSAGAAASALAQVFGVPETRVSFERARPPVESMSPSEPTQLSPVVTNAAVANSAAAGVRATGDLIALGKTENALAESPRKLWPIAAGVGVIAALAVATALALGGRSVEASPDPGSASARVASSTAPDEGTKAEPSVQPALDAALAPLASAAPSAAKPEPPRPSGKGPTPRGNPSPISPRAGEATPAKPGGNEVWGER
jgi:eukaryotic-like serine/threonine-protein kinase